MRSLERTALHAAYRAGTLTPEDVVADVYDRIAARGEDAVWIDLVPRENALAAARDLAGRFPGPDLPPLFGLPFGVKDNVDVAGLPTTAACPDFAYVPGETAPVVRRALDAGAVLIGKTNLDQFATGLSGTRSPYGIVRNPHHPDVISGGSSSGSAVAVAAGLVTFAIGTDTAGSGRVPAGLTGTVGVKPSRGLVSTRGIVPACRSLDCASVFALTVDDGAAVLAAVAGPDEGDPFSRDLPVPTDAVPATDLAALRIGVPAALDVTADFDGDAAAAAAFAGAVERLGRAGARLVPVDLAPFLDVGALLYSGPWIAERAAGLEDFLTARPDALHPVTRTVLAGAGRVAGPEVFRGLHALAAARKRTAPVWDDVDALLVPTAPTAPTIERMLADPVGANTVLGRFTNFVNLLDLAGIAVPSEVGPDGVPIGVTFLAPSGADALLLGLGAAWQDALGLPLATGHARAPKPNEALLAVVGAHLEGEPLHGDLLRLGARLAERTTTAAEYRLFALTRRDGPARPGLVRVSEGGGAIEAEVYRLPVESLGRLVTGVPAPLAIGTVRLADGRGVPGFLCEHAGAVGSQDISAYGGWRAFRRASSSTRADLAPHAPV